MPFTQVSSYWLPSSISACPVCQKHVQLEPFPFSSSAKYLLSDNYTVIPVVATCNVEQRLPLCADSTEVTGDIAEELLRAADQYMLDNLKHLCEEFISQGLSMDNLTETYDLAENFNAPQLGRRCALFALEHYVVSCRFPLRNC